MGGNRAIEGAAVPVNILSETSIFQQSPSPSPSSSLPSGDNDHTVLMIPRDTLQTALARNTAERQPRVREVAWRAGIMCRAQLCHGGPAAAVRRSCPACATATGCSAGSGASQASGASRTRRSSRRWSNARGPVL